MSETLKKRFRGFMPVVVDVETGGVNPQKDALLEIAMVTLRFDEADQLVAHNTYHFHVEAFEGGNISQEALKINNIDPHHPFRFAVTEKKALESLIKSINDELAETKCQRAVLVGHNAWFDLHFFNAAIARTKLKSPFHQFTSFDTATLAALFFGETILAKALRAAGINFDQKEAHSAIYDTKKTAELFCYIVNHHKSLKNHP
ncbi:MAG: ribonuclease T, partial [Coxiellaceae bacterium]|nr:ribonuclease T [Coxiellaceae bacterium]